MERRGTDAQQSACYKWEAAVFGDYGPSLTDDQIDELVQKLSDRYGIEAPDWRFYGTHGNCYYSPGEHCVTLREGWGRGAQVVIHEVCHAITAYLMPKAAWHGAEFCSLELAIWKQCFPDLDLKLARFAGANQKPRRVRFAPNKAIPQPATRTRLPKYEMSFASFHELTRVKMAAKRAADRAYHQDLAARKANPDYERRPLQRPEPEAAEPEAEVVPRSWLNALR